MIPAPPLIGNRRKGTKKKKRKKKNKEANRGWRRAKRCRTSIATDGALPLRALLAPGASRNGLAGWLHPGLAFNDGSDNYCRPRPLLPPLSALSPRIASFFSCLSCILLVVVSFGRLLLVTSRRFGAFGCSSFLDGPPALLLLLDSSCLLPGSAPYIASFFGTFRLFNNPGTLFDLIAGSSLRPYLDANSRTSTGGLTAV